MQFKKSMVFGSTIPVSVRMLQTCLLDTSSGANTCAEVGANAGPVPMREFDAVKLTEPCHLNLPCSQIQNSNPALTIQVFIGMHVAASDFYDNKQLRERTWKEGLYHLTSIWNIIPNVISRKNNRTEIERLDRERKADFKSMLKGFVHNKI
ncbi:hypothetical protein L6452_14025 [Arctium lappa]|uniref:Uncharacterized protein n=1 Tax=Arctium lappa TaxID=4217 RepID=A0ACB9CJX2_ARCLA|nr:hypothetical protein L6452_14025 [Arctium lappa]